MIRLFKYPAACLAALTLFSALLGDARAAVNVGDTPNIDFVATNGTRVTSEALRGRVVIVDFWATWCGPCVASMPHMIELNNQYASQGVQVLGISRDRDRKALDRFVRRRPMPWPQFFDYEATGRMSRQWGVSGIPHVFLLSPEGQVLWRGHPARMDEPFRQALRDHPPTPPAEAEDSPSMVQLRADAVTALRKARTAIEHDDAEQVLALVGEVPEEVLTDRRILANARVVLAKLELTPDVAEALQAAREANPEAAERFAALAEAVAGAAPIAEDDPQRPTVHPQIIGSKFDQAEKAREAGKHYRAYTLYDWLLDRAGETEQGHSAAQRIAEYEADQTLIAVIRAEQQNRDAMGLISLAKNYQAAGNLDAARATYERVLNEYQDAAECCAQAKAALKELDKL